MLLHEFMTGHRDEILNTCLARIRTSQPKEQLSVVLSRFFDGLIGVLREGAGIPDGTRASVPSEEAARAVLARCLEQAVTLAQLAHGYASSEESASPRLDTSTVLGEVPAMIAVRAGVVQLARRSRTPVLIAGELGTGKRHCALALHGATYPEGAFFELDGPVQAAALTSKVAALKQRSSSAAISGMTIYVHELSDASAAVQLSLSQLAREQTLQLRVVASSRRPLAQLARNGQLRQDLVFSFPARIELPPLRDRAADIPLLARHFSALTAERVGVAPTELSEAALARLRRHEWPGNLSELLNLVRHLSLSVGPGVADESDLPALTLPAPEAEFQLPRGGIDLGQLERDLVVQALALAKNNQTRAAELLGLTRDQVRYRIVKFGMQAADPSRRD